ncbi:MAG: class I SAM-dependent methyltransferase [Acidimicrobiia bacterium]|nr:cyclopropane-fatty-acyl-phospholipid synthase family protein [Acidimicrobiia bacterium]NNL97023.1 class I SAM-dependent methyltransferase [Acidimicrobiia bacterium]
MEDDVLGLNRDVYETLTSLTDAPPPAVRTWTGETWGPDDAAATLVLTHESALRVMFLPPSDLVAGEAYIFGDVDIEGDIFAALAFGAGLDDARRHPVKALKLMRRLRKLPEAPGHEDRRPTRVGRLPSKSRDQDSARFHYETGNDFFASFLDLRMVYSSGYFLDSSESLEQAQLRKLDVACRKVQLAPGQRLLDVACEWGALAIHAALEYDVEVLGITLNPEQAEEARRRAKEAGVADRVTIRVQDYREVEGTFDAVTSIGMHEHVGSKELGAYFERLFELLGPRGILLTHGITTRQRKSKAKQTFISTYVFSDGELRPVEMSLKAAEGAGFQVRDLESLRPSYALTLRRWLANLEQNPIVESEVDAIRHRLFRLYLAGAALTFESHSGGSDVYQMVAVKPERPWTLGRSFMIAGDDS